MSATSVDVMSGFSTKLLVKTAQSGLDEVSNLVMRYERRLIFKWQDERQARHAARSAKAARAALTELERRLERVQP